MFKLRTKEEVLEVFVSKYPTVDKFVKDEIEKEYDRYLCLLKSLESKEEALEVFEKEIEENETNYRDNQQVRLLEGASNNRFMDVLEDYGKIVFLRDTMLV